MTAPNTPPQRRILGPLIGAGAVAMFLGLSVYAYATFEPDIIEEEAAETPEGEATDADATDTDG